MRLSGVNRLEWPFLALAAGFAQSGCHIRGKAVEASNQKTAKNRRCSIDVGAMVAIKFTQLQSLWSRFFKEVRNPAFKLTSTVFILSNTKGGFIP